MFGALLCIFTCDYCTLLVVLFCAISKVLKVTSFTFYLGCIYDLFSDATMQNTNKNQKKEFKIHTIINSENSLMFVGKPKILQP